MPKEKKPPVPDVLRTEVHAITLDAVESSQIHSVGYDASTETLAVRFKQWDGELSDEYRYSNVDSDLAARFGMAESLGRFHSTTFRDNPDYPCVRVREPLIAVGATNVS